MAQPAPPRPLALNALAQAERRAARLAAGLWLGVLAASAGGLEAGIGPLPVAIRLALLLMAAPALLTLAALARGDGPRRRALLVVSWAVAGCLACALAGGLSGPLMPWCLAPVAAATVLGRRRLLAEAAAVAVLGGALAALAQAAGLEPAPPAEPLRFLLALFALSSLGLGLAAGLVRAGRGGEVSAPARSELEAILVQQPQLVLVLSGEGVVETAYGSPPLGVTEAALRKGVQALVEPSDLPALAEAMDRGLRGEPAEAVCGLAGDPERALALALRVSPEGRLLGILRDATAERQRAAGLEQAKAAAEALNSGKSRFLANMSHELRTPLNTIMGFSDIMRARLFGPMPAKYGEYAELIHDAGKHLLDLINDLLDMSKIEAERFQLHPETLDARDPVSAALRLMRVQADDAGLSLRAALPPDPLQVEADPRALKQITLNLLSNALKFTPRGGQVTLTLQAAGEALELMVADTGVGVAPEDLARLGRPYEQAGDAGQRAKGTGLGLSLVRGLAELHGGGMTIESTLGEGTSVVVRLPVLRPEQPEADERPSAQVIAFTPGR